MSLGHGSKIITDGLVFAYDMGSIKSYNGPQTTNSTTGIVPLYSTQSSLFTMYPTYEDVYVPQIGWVRNCLAMTMYNDYNGGSGNCCPSPIAYYTGGNTTTNIKSSTVYTYAIVYKSTNGYTHPNFMYRYEYGPSGYLTEGGIHNTSNRIHLGNDWYWAWGTFTTQSATTSMTPRCFQYQYATWNKLYLAKAMLIEGNYTGLHPKYWPDLSETVSSTNSVLDWTGNNTITANSLTYNSDGTFNFVGVGGVGVAGDYISCGNSSAINFGFGDFTISFISYITSTGYQVGSFISKGDGTSLGFDFRDSNFYVHGTTGLIAQRGFDPTLNVWQQHDFVFNRSSSPYIKYYLNGEYNSASTTNNAANIGSSINTSRNLDIARSQAGGVQRYFNGKMPVVKLYNRALSAEEIKQNFNALRGRYGI